MKVLGVIPARYNSSRFPGKPLVDLKGKSMIQRVYEGAKKSNMLNRLIVATDDNRIVNEVNRFGGEVMMTKSSHNSGTERCAEVAKKIGEYDIVINIQGDEPLVNSNQLDQLIDVFKDKKNQIATLGIETSEIKEIENSNRIKIVCDVNNNAMYFSRSTIPFNRDKHTNQNYLRHIGLYAYRSNTLQEICKLSPSQIEKTESLEQLRWLYYGFPIYVLKTNIETPNIDTPDDLKAVINLL